MFISYGMFIGLIIATIIMIALIVYLTFTGGNNKSKSRHLKAHQAEEAAKERLAQNDTSQSTNQYFEPEISPNQDEFRYEWEKENHSYQEPHSEHTIEEDDPLRILPYPKDNDFK